MQVEQFIANEVQKAIKQLFEANIEINQIKIEQTNPDFEGDFTVLVFPFVRFSKSSPEQTAERLGNQIVSNNTTFTDFNVVKGFLNLSLADKYWLTWLKELNLTTFGKPIDKPNEKVVVEYSSPNTNKPLHLGHIRNIILGHSVSNLLSFYGYDVKKVNLINDRGIHICKSMLAYQKFGNEETPETSGLKGDHLIGKYYVMFDRYYKEQLKIEVSNEYQSKISQAQMTGIWTLPNIEAEPILRLINKYYDNALLDYIEEVLELGNDFDRNKISAISTFSLKDVGLEKQVLEKRAKFINILKINKFLNIELFDKDDSDDLIIKKYLDIALLRIYKALESENAVINKIPLLKEAQQMLLKWEDGDTETIALWKKLNGWVYDGFEVSYKNLGVSFDKFYYESETYLLGKEMVEEGLSKEVFYKKEDGSVWIDLEKEKLDHKLLLRSDGTSVYITQDMGTADLKYSDFACDKSIIVVGNEQDYHFKVLFSILNKLERPYAAGNYHLSYGMVDLPSGKMKSREGTVVDADDLMAEMIAAAKEKTDALGKTDGMPEGEMLQLHYNIGMAALKYFILKVDPIKRMMFDPKESIDLQGDTGPFIQYSYTRIQSILRQTQTATVDTTCQLHPTERNLLILLNQFANAVEKAVLSYSPAVMANYIYDVAKSFNKLYAEVPLLKELDEAKRQNRMAICNATAYVLKTGLNILGINAPERM